MSVERPTADAAKCSARSLKRRRSPASRPYGLFPAQSEQLGFPLEDPLQQNMSTLVTSHKDNLVSSLQLGATTKGHLFQLI